MNKLPIYKATISNEDSGMYAISLVDDPAVEINWQYFKNEKEPITFAVQDEEKRIIRGVIMECDKLIYRRTSAGFEYLIQFDAETIRIMAQKYLKDGMQNNVDLMHNGELVQGVQLVQWFISDKENGINPTGFEGVNDHSLFAEFHVENDEIWEAIKNHTFKGFSLAGYFDPIPVEIENNKHNNNKVMSKLNKIREMLQGILAQFDRISTDKALLEWDGEGELEIGMSVHGIDEEGNEFALEDGEYRTDTNRVYVIKDGKVEDIRDEEIVEEPAAEEAPEEAPVVEEQAEEEAPEAAEEPEAEEDPRDRRIADLEAEIARLEEENGALRERIEELENKPQADPIEEDFEKVVKTAKTGNKGLDNLMRVLNS